MINPPRKRIILIHLSNFSMILQMPKQHLQVPVQTFQQPEIPLANLDILGVVSFCVVEVLRASWALGVVSLGCVLEELLASWLLGVVSLGWVLEELLTSWLTGILTTTDTHSFNDQRDNAGFD